MATFAPEFEDELIRKTFKQLELGGTFICYLFRGFSRIQSFINNLMTTIKTKLILKTSNFYQRALSNEKVC